MSTKSPADCGDEAGSGAAAGTGAVKTRRGAAKPELRGLGDSIIWFMMVGKAW